ncbi:MAG: hypothetical protein Q4C77_01510 [Eubacteriales bacterium]|nr:hypothetical protein [Eubacteriales bacterium]
MNMTMRSVKFWGRLCMECLGLSLGAALVWLLFVGAGSGELFGTAGEILAGVLSLYPYYLLIVGAVLTAVMGMTYFQVYFPVVLSMNATRKSIARGIVGCMAGLVVGLLLISSAVWRLVPGEISSSGWGLMPLFTGILFLIAALGLLLGAVAARWGKVGMIMAGIMCALVGAGAGMTVALSDKGIIEFVTSIADGDFKLLAAAGVVLYLAAGVFVSRSLRKLEVRA